MKKSTIDRQIEFSKKYPDVIPIPLYSDALAKAILIRNPDILAMFLKAVLKINIKELNLRNVELPINSIKEQNKNVDLFVAINDKYLVDIEFNQQRFKDVLERNIAYAYKIRAINIEKGSKIEDINKYQVYQLNLNTNTSEKEELEDEGICIGTKTNKTLSINPTILVKNLDKYRKLYYNGDRREEVVWLTMWTSTKYSELKEILSNVLKEERNKELVEVIGKMCFEDFLVEKWDEEKWNKMILEKEKKRARQSGMTKGLKEGRKKGMIEGRIEGLKEGRKEGREEGLLEGKAQGMIQGLEQGFLEGYKESEKILIENMFKNQLDISLISNITGTPIKKLEKMKTNLFL